MLEQPPDAARLAALEAQVEAGRAEIAQLRQGLVNARTIGAAIGIAMASRKLTQDAAFEVLVHASQQTQRKLRDVAADVVATGEVPA